jgi:hypothetical protein
MYELKSIDMRDAGLAMGFASTHTNFRKYFTTLEEAKEYALGDYRTQVKNPDASFPWTYVKGGAHSPDLRFVMYEIKELVPEDDSYDSSLGGFRKE